MLREDVLRVCAPSMTEAAVDKLMAILRVLSGLEAEEARALLGYAGHAVDRMAVMPEFADRDGHAATCASAGPSAACYCGDAKTASAL
jgi:hypothetical protein